VLRVKEQHMTTHIEKLRHEDRIEVVRGERVLTVRPEELCIGDKYRWDQPYLYELACSLACTEARDLRHLEPFFFSGRWWMMTGTRTAYQLEGTNQPYAKPVKGAEVRDFNGSFKVQRLLHLPQEALCAEPSAA
jgi:hypothetical protein